MRTCVHLCGLFGVDEEIERIMHAYSLLTDQDWRAKHTRYGDIVAFVEESKGERWSCTCFDFRRSQEELAALTALGDSVALSTGRVALSCKHVRAASRELSDSTRFGGRVDAYIVNGKTAVYSVVCELECAQCDAAIEFATTRWQCPDCRCVKEADPPSRDDDYHEAKRRRVSELVFV